MQGKSKDLMAEGLKEILLGGGWGGADLPSEAGAAELEAYFLRELRKRRERLARWMQSIREEALRNSVSRPRLPRRHRCRARGTGRAAA